MTEWRGGQKPALFAAIALREWLSTKAADWGEVVVLPDDHDWNDLPLYEIAIRELERIGEEHD